MRVLSEPRASSRWLCFWIVVKSICLESVIWGWSRNRDLVEVGGVFECGYIL